MLEAAAEPVRLLERASLRQLATNIRQALFVEQNAIPARAVLLEQLERPRPKPIRHRRHLPLMLSRLRTASRHGAPRPVNLAVKQVAHVTLVHAAVDHEQQRELELPRGSVDDVPNFLYRPGLDRLVGTAEGERI